MNVTSFRLVLLGALAGWLAPAGGVQAQQQNAVIAGQVTSEQGQALEGAQVSITQLGVGTTTNAAGRYTLTIPAARVAGQSVTLRIRHIGYIPASRIVNITAGQQTVDFAMGLDINRLAEVVVTGVTGATEQARLPFTVSTVTEKDMPVPGQSALSQLQGKVPGANIVSASGRPGSSPSIILRGPKSIDASQGRGQSPLFIIDGIAISGSLPDLNPQDIESIEIVKGAAASSLYGSRAGNGVIQIRTKRGGGTDGVRFTLRTEAGAGDIEREFRLSQRHFLLMDETRTRFCVVATGLPACARTVDLAEEALRINEQAPGAQSLPPATFIRDFGIARSPSKSELRGLFQVNRWPQEYDAIDQSITNGTFVNSNLDMSGRFGGANFFASLSHFQQDGVFRYLDGFRRSSVRLNMDQQIGEDVQVGLTTFYSRGKEGAQNTEGGTGFFRLTRVPAGVDLLRTDRFGRLFVRSNPLNQGAQNSNPLYIFQNERETDESDRFLGSLNVRYTPVEWFTLEGNAGYDRAAGSEFFIRDAGFRISQPSATLPLGFISRESSEAQSYNTSLTATATRTFFGELETRALAQYLYEQQDGLDTDLEGIDLAAAGLTTAEAASQNLDIDSDETTARAIGVLGGISATYKGRYIVDAVLRHDGSSLFGEANRWATYGRGSVAWRVSDEPWWFAPDQVSDLKLRASIGTAGGRPAFAQQYETFTIATGGVLSPATLGNRNLRPEVTTEQEYGIDLELFRRIGLNVTYAFAETEDQILLVPPSQATGFTNQWQNAGTLENKTWEVSLNVPIVTRRDLSWSTRLSWDQTRTIITKLGVPTFFDGPPQQGAETMFRFGEGERYGTIYGRKFITSCSDLPAPFSSQCGPGQAFQTNDEGYIVWVGNAMCGGQPCGLGDGIKYNLWQSTLPGCVNPATGGAINVSGGTACRQAGGVVNAPFGVEMSWGNAIILRDADANGLNVPLGNVMPDYRFSVSQTVTWKNFSAYGLLDAAIGQEIWNEGRHWSLGDFQVRETDQTGKSVETAKPLGHYWRTAAPEHSAGVGGFYDQLQPNSRTVETASYAKIREVSLAYNFGPLFNTGDWTVSLIGRNLKTFTDYTGFDPETGRAGGITGSAALNGIDAFQYPNPRTFTVSVTTRF
jgi:TonB-linked SusC/RagA family outer membrane protein